MSTFVLLLAWIGFAAHLRGGQGAGLQGVVYIVPLFLCLLLHEFGDRTSPGNR